MTGHKIQNFQQNNRNKQALGIANFKGAEFLKSTVTHLPNAGVVLIAQTPHVHIGKDEGKCNS